MSYILLNNVFNSKGQRKSWSWLLWLNSISYELNRNANPQPKLPFCLCKKTRSTSLKKINTTSSSTILSFSFLAIFFFYSSSASLHPSVFLSLLFSPIIVPTLSKQISQMATAGRHDRKKMNWSFPEPRGSRELFLHSLYSEWGVSLPSQSNPTPLPVYF